LTSAGFPAEAEKNYLEAVTLHEVLVRTEPDRATWRDWLAGACSELGRIQGKRGKVREAEQSLRRAEDLLAKLAVDFPAIPSYRHHQADALFQVGGLLASAGRPMDAAKELGRGVELVQKLVREFPSNVDYRTQLANGYVNLGHALSVGKGLPADIENAYSKAVPLLEGLIAALPGRFDLRLDLAGAHSRLGRLLGNRQQVAAARQAYQQALALEGKLALDAPAQPGSRERWISLSFHLGELAFSLGELKEARRLLERTVTLQLAWKPAERPATYATELSADYYELISVLIKLGDHSEASRRAHELTRHFPTGIREHIRAGACLSGCALQAEKDQRLPPEKRRVLAASYADQAVAVLRTAIRLGGSDAHALRQNLLRGIQAQPNAAALRAYPSYRQLLEELEADTPQ
jgi:tetratricopeptide (TPR) repeat protein